MKLITAFLMVFILAFSSAAFFMGGFSIDGAKEVGRALSESTLDYPNNVWPGSGWKDLLVVMLDNEGKKAFVWNRDQEGGVGEVSYSALPPNLRTDGNWSRSKWKERIALSVALEKSNYDIDDILILLCHEGFHIVGQALWKSKSGATFRGDIYPENWRPRYLRRMIMDALYRAFVKKERGAVGESVYWHNLYSVQFPEEKNRNFEVDRLEGSAEYVGLFGVVFGRLGSGASKLKLYDDLRKLFARRWKTKYNNFHHKGSLKEGESYAIGPLAGFILDLKGIKGWKLRVAGGETPMDVLAKSVPPLKAAEDLGIKEKVIKYYELKNIELKNIIDAYEEKTDSLEYVLIAAPLDWAAGGSWGRKGFLSFGKKKMIVGLDGKFYSPDSPSNIQVKGVNAELIFAPYPAGKNIFGYVVFPVKKDKSINNSILTDNIKGYALQLERDRNTRIYYLK
ncbi:MAG: hypothetical protein U9R38_00620 [Candidatus Margulisiibacteriota bacterium]|nr:hypothetical protein [Candidatus Margulisiibacteriota bacterium]